MSKKQLKLAKYILENAGETAFLTSAKLGEKAGVSEATVIRFAQFLGFSGFKDVKENLQQAIKEKITPQVKMKETIERIKNKENVFFNLLSIDKATLDEVNRNCSEKNIKRAIEFLRKARIIYIIGLGISRAIVNFLEFRLNRLGYNVITITSGGEEVIDKLMSTTQKDVIIGIGFFRPHRELIAALEMVKQKGVPIITITDSEFSPIAKNADVILNAKRGPAELMTSLVAPMSVANILILTLAMEDKKRSIDLFTKLDKLKEKYKL
jgi:DNA-binding MurR/RpiR family transcriptional regulator